MLYSATQRAKPDYDQLLLWMSVSLLVFGLVMVYSSSIEIAENDRELGNQSTYYLLRHAINMALGLLLAAAAFQIPMRWWQVAAPYLFIGGIASLVLVLIPALAPEIKGARRWLRLAGFQVQPSEFVKLAVVLYAADYTVRKAAFMHSFQKGFLPMLGVMLLSGGLLLLEPDFGAFAVVAAVAVAILFLGGLHWRLFVGMIALLIVGFVILIVIAPYRLQRVWGSMDPWSDPYGAGYQLSHALIAFGRGELFGVGLGASVEKLLYLPEAHTDFLLAVIAEEMGLIGVLVVLGLFAYLVAKAFAIGGQAATRERYFSALVAQGLGTLIGVQAVINLGVNMGVLPTKGLTLPLLSYGGSALLSACIAIGILLRVDYENRQLMRGREV